MCNAIILLELVECPTLSAELCLRLDIETCVLENSSLKTACWKVDVSVSKPEELELSRRMFCNQKGIRSDFEKLAKLMDRDPDVIFSANET
jgi:hypothetical protein